MGGTAMAIVQAIMKLFIRLLLKLPGSWLVKMSGGSPTVIRAALKIRFPVG